MLLWQHNVRKKWAVWGRFVLAAMTLHFLFLGTILFFQGSDQRTVHINANAHIDWQHAKIVVLPFHRVAPSALRGGGGAKGGARASSASQKTTPSVAKKTVRKKPNTSMRSERTKQKTAVAKPVKKKPTTSAQLKKKEPIKKVAEAKKQSQKPKPQKQSTKKIVEKPKIDAAPPVEKEVIAQKTETPVEPAVVAPLLPVIPELLAVSASHAGAVTDGTVYVGQAEMDAFRLQQEIQQELETHWRPPVGIPEVTCQIKALIDAHGAAQTVTMVKASGVLLYDVSARSAVQAIHFPASARGKELVITFS